MYQVRDALGNTRVTNPASPTLQWTSGGATHGIACGGADGISGIGECYGALSGALFESAGTVALSLAWPGAVGLPSFATVALQKEPLWSQAGGYGDHRGWNTPSTTVTQDVAFGIVLPYEDIFIDAGASVATFDARVYLKTLMAEDSTAERQVAIGAFKVLYPPASCSVSGDNGRHSGFETWEPITGLAAGEYGLRFDSGAVMGYANLMVTIQLVCGAGTHRVSVQTISYADSNALSFAPRAVYPTSVGRGDAYVEEAEVLVKATITDKGVLTYASDGRV